MAVFRSFSSADVVACFNEASGGGGLKDINAPRNAPAKDPASHLDKLIWHSRCFQYEVAAGPVDVTINHTALATKSVYHGINSGGGYVIGPSAPDIGFLVLGDTRPLDILLFTHGLGYVPKFMVSLDGRRVPDGLIVQLNARGGARSVTVYATSTGIYLRELAASTDVALAAVAITYTVMVFRTRSPASDIPLFSGLGSLLQVARGIINSSRRYLRRTGAGDTPFAMNLDTTIDIKNGGARSASGGIVVDEPRYNGAMPAPAFVSVGV